MRGKGMSVSGFQ